MTLKPSLRLAASLLLFAATSSVAISLVNARLSRRAGADTIITPDEPASVAVTPSATRRLSVDSRPDGAIVTLDGAVVGQTPWQTDWRCVEGAPVRLTLERPGFVTRALVVGCQAGHTHVSSTLEPAAR